MIRETWEDLPKKSVTDKLFFSGTWYFKYDRKPDWNICKFKAQYCVRGDPQKRISPEPLNPYSPVVQCSTVRLMLIYQCILGLQRKTIYFKKSFDQADILSWDPVFIGLSRDLNIDGGKFDVVLRLKKILYGQAESAHLWYEKLRNGF